MSLVISRIINGSTPNKERIFLEAEADLSTKGYAIFDRTFDPEEEVSNEFRHIYILPDIKLKKNEEIVIYIGNGTNGKRKYAGSEKEYYALFWGSEHCILNDNGDDTITLIKYSVVHSEKVPAI